MLTRLGEFTVRHRRMVLASTALFMVVAAVLGAGAFGVLKGGGFEDPASESQRAATILDERFDTGDPEVVLVVTATGGQIDAQDVLPAVDGLLADLTAIDEVGTVTSYWSLGSPEVLRSDDGSAALVLVQLDGDEDASDQAVMDIRAMVDRDLGAISVGVGGSAAVFADVGHTIEGDLVRAEMIAIPLTLLLLLVVFGGLVAASLPLLVGVIAVLGTFLSLFLIGSTTDVSIFAINLTTALGLGLAIDYSLFVVSRYREELRNGRSVEAAVIRTVETAGRTIIISAFTVAVSLSALLVFPQYFLRSFAYAGIAVVLLAMLSTIITLPALLAVVGHRIDSLRVLPRRRVRSETEGFWYRTAQRVMRRPIPVALGVTALLLFLGSPFLRVEFANPDDRVLPESAASRVVADELRSGFDGNAASAFAIAVDDLNGSSQDDVTALAVEVSMLDGVARVDAAAGTFAGGAQVAPPGPGSDRFVTDGAAWMSVVPSIEMSSGVGEELVRQIRALDTPLDTAVGGAAASLVDSKASIGQRLPIALGIIVVATVVLLFLLSGSLLVPLKALLLNVLSLTATFGAMVWIFQDGNLSGLFGFTATGAIDVSMPILMFCIAFGLSMDYEVFLLSRIKEEHDRTGDNDLSVALGLERTGRIVTAAALLLSITFFSFGTSGVSFITMFGIGLGLAVLMDAFVVRGTLVPAFMKLAGEANWWAPAPLRRLHDKIGLREGDPIDHPGGSSPSTLTIPDTNSVSFVPDPGSPRAQDGSANGSEVLVGADE